MIEIIKDYFYSFRFLVVLLAFGLSFIAIIVKDLYSYKQEKDAKKQLINIENKQDNINKKLDLVLRESVIASGDWKTVDISSAVPPVASNTAFLLFRSKWGTVSGYVKGLSIGELYPFDSSLNNDKVPIAVKIKETKIQYKITSTNPKNKAIPFEILVAGYRFNR